MSTLPLLHTGALARPARRVWLWPHLLSLDAPCVALAWQWLLLRCAHETWQAAPAAALGMTVWLIYAADRMLDSWRDKPSLSTARHRFYAQHRGRVAPVMALVALSVIWLVRTSLDSLLIERGLLVGACVGGYLAVVHLAPGSLRAWLPKELSVGFLFAAGAGVSVLRIATSLLLALLLFGVLCWANCAAIEAWESERPAPPLGLVTGFACACLTGAAIAGADTRLFAAGALGSAGLWLLDRAKGSLSADALRVLADAVLVTPLLFR